MIALLLTLALSPAAMTPAPVRPNRELTPGVLAINDKTDRPFTGAETCAIKWGKDVRHVTLSMKKQVFEAYGIPWEKHSLYEVDHLISRELGGDDDVDNLWPELWTGAHNAHMKDRLENALHRKVCKGEITLEFAQKTIVSDWIAAYRLHVPAK